MISPYSLTLPGGVQAQILGLATSLRRAGIDVRVLGPCDGPPPAVGVTPLGNSVPTAANGSIAPLAPDVPAQLRTMRALWEENFDVLHLHEPIAPGPTMTATLIKPCPIIGTFHAAGTSAAYRYINWGCRYLLSRIDLSCAVSQAAEDMATSQIGGTYERVFNGVDIDHYGTAKPYPTQGPTIFFVGRHEKRKGLEVLLDAMAQLPRSVRLWVGGDGPETARLQRSAAGADPRIEWLGRLDEAEKASRLRGADIFCAPSLRGESFGVVLLEAMAAETAIVASALDGYSRVAEHGVHAELVPPGDSARLALALGEVLFDSGRAPRLVRAGIERVEQFSMDRLARRYIELYERLL